MVGDSAEITLGVIVKALSRSISPQLTVKAKRLILWLLI